MKRFPILMAQCCLMLLTLGATGAMAQPKGLVNVAQVGGYCYALRIVGDLAYLAEGNNLTILNIANKERPVRVGGLMLDFSTRFIVVSGTKAYVAGEKIVQIVDVADPAAPLRQGRIQTPWVITSIAAQGNTVYVAQDREPLHIFDVSNPAAPVDRTPAPNPIRGWVVQLATSGSMLYALAQDQDGTTLTLHALDATQPAKPVGRGSFTFDKNSGANQLAVSDGKVVVARLFATMASFTRIHFIDARNPARMVQKKFVDTGYNIVGVGIEGSLACVAKYSSDVRMTFFDCGNMDAIRETGGCVLPRAFTYHYYLKSPIGITGGYAYAALGNGVPIVDARNPSAPRVANLYALPDMPGRACVVNGLAYVPDGNRGLKIMDVSRPGVPGFKGSYYSGVTGSVAVENGRAALVTGNNYDLLHILDVKDPAQPRLLGEYSAQPDTTRIWRIGGVAIRGNLAYLAIWQWGLEILDITNPAKPVKIGSLPMVKTLGSIALGKNCLLVKADGLALIDVSNPRAPVRKSTIPFTDNAYHIDYKLVGNLVYCILGVTTTYSGSSLKIFDISALSQPRLRNSVSLKGNPYQATLGVEGNVLAVATGPYSGLSELLIFNLSNPVQPVLVDTYPLLLAPWGRPWGLNVIGGYFYAWMDKGLQVYHNTPIHVFSPGGPATYRGGDAVRLHWKSDLTYAGTGTLLELWNSVGRVATLGYDWSPRGENGKLVNLPLVPVGSDYRLRVRSTWNSQLWGQSERPFTIAGGPVRVMTPNGGETWQAGTRQNVWWKINPQQAGGTVWIELWRAGQKVARLAGGTDADGEAVTSVFLPSTLAAGTDYKVRVISAFKPAWWDESDKAITIRK